MNRDQRLVGALTVAAFAGRFALRIGQPESEFIRSGYASYLTIAQNALSGHGLCIAPNVECAVREPVYPLFIAAFAAAGEMFTGLVVSQATLGALAVWLVWRIGCLLFNPRAALVAAALTAVSPYALIHDTALQDTVIVNVLTLAALYSWLLACRGALWPAFTAGVFAALATLTNARQMAALVIWTAVIGASGEQPRRQRARQFVAAALPILLLVGGWIARNQLTVGSPVLSSETGRRVWAANNDWTFSHFPVESIDVSYHESIDRLDPDRRSALAAVAGNEIGENRLFLRWGFDWLAAHPWRAAEGAARKIWFVLSAQLSPARAPEFQIGYRLFFLPLHVLAAIGLWRSRAAWKAHWPAYALLCSFLIVTGVFWAHTSHKSLIDPVLFVYAASMVSSKTWQRSSSRAGSR